MSRKEDKTTKPKNPKPNTRDPNPTQERKLGKGKREKREEKRREKREGPLILKQYRSISDRLWAQTPGCGLDDGNVFDQICTSKFHGIDWTTHRNKVEHRWEFLLFKCVLSEVDPLEVR